MKGIKQFILAFVFILAMSIVNNAFAAEKKTYPIRWLIVVASTFSAFLLTLILLLFVESFKSIKQNNI